MKIEITKHDLTRVVELEGELDDEGSAELEERCLYEQQEGALYFVIVLAGVERVTGSGLRVLLGLARSLPRTGGSLVLCAMERRVAEALQVSGLEGAFETAADRETALGRSKELKESGAKARSLHRADVEKKIDFAIELLGSSDPASERKPPPRH
jgi:anti-anti-sigma factor